MLSSIFATATSATETTITMSNLLLALLTAFATGILLSVIYMKTHKDNNPSQSFALTLVILPAVIAVIILLVGSNIARAFSLAGAFSIIRFRSAPGDPKDIAYVLFSLAVGLSCGMGYLVYAIVFAMIVCAVMLLLHAIKFGKTQVTGKLLKIVIPENLDYQNALEDILDQFTLSHTLLKVKTADLGSLYELVYQVTTRDDIKEKDFIDELRCRNGNLNITLVMNAQTAEY
jgi:hypothetical protein